MAARWSAATVPRRPRRRWGSAVSGLVDSGKLLRKAGLRAGDRLILTKPLGTGLILAGQHARAGAGDMAAGGDRVDAGNQRQRPAASSWRTGRAREPM